MNTESNMKKNLLYVLIGSIVASAGLAIFFVLRDEWGWFEIKVLLSTCTIAVASLCGLACELSRTIRGLNLLPRSGVLLTLVTATLYLIGIWPEIDSEIYWKSVAVLTIFVFAVVQASLLSIARLAKRFSWVYMLTLQVVFGLAILCSVMCVFEIDDDRTMRFLIALSIVDAALTLVIPVLHRISKSDPQGQLLISPLEERSLDTIDQEIKQLQERLAKLELMRKEIEKSASSPEDKGLTDEGHYVTN